MTRGVAAIALVVAAGALALLVATQALAAMTEAEAREAVEKEFGVRVLKLEKREFRGRPAYLITVMSPGGNDNAAFQVNLLALDPATGKLISGFHHRSSGAEAAGGAPLRETDRQPPDALRQGWLWR